MTTDYTCPICDTTKPSFQWTDTHGVAQCRVCGAPTLLYHYDDAKQRIDKGPECLVGAKWIPLLRQYRADTGRVIPGGHSFSQDYELARPRDVQAFRAWCSEHRDALPQPEAVPA